MNDIILPEKDLQSHEIFELRDKNLFSASHVDVFFEKSFDKKRDFVVMDA